MRLVTECHDATRYFKQGRPRLRQCNSPRSADEEFDAVSLFELPHLNGQGRLADIQDFGRGGKAAMHGYPVEGAKLAEHYWHNQWYALLICICQ
jgi:hypothetical protein